MANGTRANGTLQNPIVAKPISLLTPYHTLCASPLWRSPSTILRIVMAPSPLLLPPRWRCTDKSFSLRQRAMFGNTQKPPPKTAPRPHLVRGAIRPPNCPTHTHIHARTLWNPKARPEHALPRPPPNHTHKPTYKKILTLTHSHLDSHSHTHTYTHSLKYLMLFRARHRC